jgi:hypothetical protein
MHVPPELRDGAVTILCRASIGNGADTNGAVPCTCRIFASENFSVAAVTNVLICSPRIVDCPQLQLRQLVEGRDAC